MLIKIVDARQLQAAAERLRGASSACLPRAERRMGHPKLTASRVRDGAEPNALWDFPSVA
jgi:hypothetical protein